MNILISGSLAYDSIMDFPGRFRDHILPDQIHILNVCFLVHDISKNYGGCGGNIAYTMKLLGHHPILVSILGKDGDAYCAYLKEQGIAVNYIQQHTKRFTSHASIITDKNNNQITAYYSGASDDSMDLSMDAVEEHHSFGIIAPTLPTTMAKHARELANRSIPFVFDPGQQLNFFSREEFKEMLSLCSFYIVNDYEMYLTEQKINKSREELCKSIETIVITKGADGSCVYTEHGNERIDIHACTPQNVVDPTGAGDAYRAGFFSACAQGYDKKTCGQVGSVAATYAIECNGTQNHRFTPQEFNDRYQKTYNKTL